MRLARISSLHIEQGPILEAEAKTIGVVTGVQGIRWYEVTVTGMESHAGSTPMAAKARCVCSVPAVWVAAINDVGLGTRAGMRWRRFGLLESRPNSRNVVPGSVFFTIDLRHPDDAVVSAMEAEMREALQRIASDAELRSTLSAYGILRRCQFRCRLHRLGAARRRAGRLRQSRTSSPAPGMIQPISPGWRRPPWCSFLVRKDLSHNEAEHAEKFDVVAGANVLPARPY